ncbi:unnamed protein product, partial [Agarophyton chilense]
ALLAHHAAAASPLRYTAVHPPRVEGWLAKEARRSLRTRRTRYFTLDGTILASHRTKSAPASWHVSLADALVEPGPLPREIRLSLPTRTLSFVAPTPPAFRMWIVALRRASLFSSRVDHYYAVGRLIGEGMNGQVRLAHDRMTHEPVAIKMVPRLRRENETHFLAREVQILLSIAHPNIVRTLDVFVRTRRIHFVMEYLPGGELFDFISQNTHFTELHAAAVMTDLLNALHYLHTRNIVHRDVKLENLLCTSTTWPLNVKLADFGFANYVNSRDRPILNSFVGTPYYIAPEMLRGDPHGCAVDVWATGVVLYILLSGKFPFGGNNESEYYQRVLAKPAYFPADEWRDVSHDAKSLVRGMLCKDPHKRLTVEQCLRHPWLARRAHALPSPSSSPSPSSTLVPPPQRALSPPEQLVVREPNLRTATALRHTRAKRGKWRHLAMLNRSLSAAPDAVLPHQLPVDYARPKHTLSDCASASCARSPPSAPPSDSASNSVVVTDSELINRRPTLIRRILSSQKLSLDRYQCPLPCARPSTATAAATAAAATSAVDNKLDHASANPRKTLSLFSKDGPLRRSFHRVADRATADGNHAINFANLQSQKLPPKIARERQRQQKLAEAAAKRGATRGGIFTTCKLAAAELAAHNQRYHSSPRLAAHMLETLQTSFVPPVSEAARLEERAACCGVEDVLEPVSSPPSVARSGMDMCGMIDEHGDEVQRAESMEYGDMESLGGVSQHQLNPLNQLHGVYSRGRAVPLGL